MNKKEKKDKGYRSFGMDKIDAKNPPKNEPKSEKRSSDTDLRGGKK